MGVKTFMLRWQFTMDRPNNIHPNRWRGMLKWMDTRVVHNDGFDFATQQRDEILEEIAWARERDRLKYRFWEDEDELTPLATYPL